jgi:hypothetical protein
METRVLIVCVNLMTPGYIPEGDVRRAMGSGLEDGGNSVEELECCDFVVVSSCRCTAPRSDFQPPTPSLELGIKVT